MLRKLDIGQRIRKGKKKSRREKEDQMKKIVLGYGEDDILKNIGYRIKFEFCLTIINCLFLIFI